MVKYNAIVASVVAIGAGCHPASEIEAVVRDPNLLGVWSRSPENLDYRFDVEERRIVISNAHDQEYVEIELLRNDPTATPSELDGVKRRGELRGRTTDDVGKSMRMIYEIDGDTLRLALYPPGSADRPAGFSEDDGVKVHEFTRVPPGAEED